MRLDDFNPPAGSGAPIGVSAALENGVSRQETDWKKKKQQKVQEGQMFHGTGQARLNSSRYVE